MVMQSLRDGASNGLLKFFLFGLLAMAGAGLVLMDVNGVFRGGVANSDVARVEDKTISINEFDRVARRTLARLGMTPEQAYQLGYMDELLAQEIRANFVIIEAEKLGITIEHDRLKKKIAQIIAPHVQEDMTPQQTLERVLSSERLSQENFVAGINREMVGDILMETVQKSFTGNSEKLARDLYIFQNQTRDIEMVIFMDEEIKDIAAPTEEQTQRLYNSFKNTRYAIPEYRTLKIALIDDQNLKSEIAISDEDLQQEYEQNMDSFQVPQQHILEQLMFKSEEESQKALSLIKNDKKTLKEAYDALNNASASYVPPAPFESESMMESIKEPVLAAEKGDVAGPVKTALGYHLIHIKDITKPRQKTFDEVKNQIMEELLFVKLGDQIYNISTDFDDLLAGGADLEEASQQVPLQIIDIPATDSFSLNKEGNNAFTAYGPQEQQDREILTQTAFELQDKEISRVIELPSGRFAAIQIISIEEKTHKPYEAVREEIVTQYIKDQQRIENAKRAEDMAKKITESKETLRALAKTENKELKKIVDISMTAPLQAPLTDNLRPLLFKEPIGGTSTVPIEGGRALITITGYNLPTVGEKIAQASFKALMASIDQETKNEAFIMYLQALGKKYPAQTNQKLLEQVYGASQEVY